MGVAPGGERGGGGELVVETRSFLVCFFPRAGSLSLWDLDLALMSFVCCFTCVCTLKRGNNRSETEQRSFFVPAACHPICHCHLPMLERFHRGKRREGEGGERNGYMSSRLLIHTE